MAKVTNRQQTKNNRQKPICKLAKAKLKTAKDNEYDTQPDKRGNRRSGVRDSAAEKKARKPRASRSKPSEIMTREDIDKLKGKLVSVENPYRSRPFIGLIYHVDGDTCYLIDGTLNRAQVKYQQTESMRETTGDEAIAEILADCKCGISDMNIEGNFVNSDE